MANEGWNYLSNSPKWHYFKADGRSLCGRWLTFSKDHQVGNDDSPDNCAACQRRVKATAKSASLGDKKPMTTDSQTSL